MDEIPLALIINWDQTEINYVPVEFWTMEIEGMENVEKLEEMTLLFAGSMTGDSYLPN